MQTRIFLLTFAGLIATVSSVARAGDIDCVNTSWNPATGVIDLRITGLAEGQTVTAAVYDDNTCTIRFNVVSAPAGADGKVPVTFGGAGVVAGDKVVVSDPGCAQLVADGTISCAASCPPCPTTGACEAPGEAPNCRCDITFEECTAIGGNFLGFGSTCSGICIPAVSEWGLLAMTLLVLCAGTVVVRRRAAVLRN